MPTLCRWWLHWQWARASRSDALARLDVALAAFGALSMALALVLR
jgi:hypothetical protein